jgi:hypothetical protein
MFSQFCRRAPVWGDSGRHTRIDRPVAPETEYLSVCRDPVGEHGGGSFTGDSEGKMNFQEMGCRRSCRRASVSVEVPLGNLGGGGDGVRFQGTLRDCGRRAPEMEHLFLRELW